MLWHWENSEEIKCSHYSQAAKLRKSSRLRHKEIVHKSRPLDTHYPHHWISGRLPSQTDPEAKNAGLVLLKNVAFTIRTLRFSFFFRTLWVLLSCVFNLQILRPLNKSLSLFSCPSLLCAHQQVHYFSQQFFHLTEDFSRCLSCSELQWCPLAVLQSSAMRPTCFPTSPAYALTPVSYTHLTLPTNWWECRSRWSPYH